uniref:Phosphoglycerate mutase n=1 Tax=Romanomermis culicivorax TaxID=13658 RepID=A0A915L473_ROMCU
MPCYTSSDSVDRRYPYAVSTDAGRHYPTKYDNVDTILMVSHAPTIVTFIRILTRKSISEDTLENASNRLAYLSAVLLEQHPITGQWWLPQPQPTPNFEIRAKTSFNQVWLNKTGYDAQ